MNATAIREAITAAVRMLMRGSTPTERMTTKDVTEVIEYVATASISIVLAQIAAEMRSQTLDESAPSGACVGDMLATARDLGYRAGNNDYARRWSKLLDEVTRAAG